MLLSTQTLSDKAAIGLSLLCVGHCFAVPLVLVLFPSVAAMQLDTEAFHLWMIVAVIPISLYALSIGCKKHRRFQLLAFGGVGLTFLVMAVALEEVLLGEMGEKIFTSIGAGLIAFGHYRNFGLCQRTKKTVLNP